MQNKDAVDIGRLDTEPLQRTEAVVVVSLLDGQRLFGRLRQFNPRDAQISLLPNPLDLMAAPVRELAQGEIAHIAFHRSPDHRPLPIPEQERWRVRAVGGEDWLVCVGAHNMGDSLGFEARPVNDSPYGSVYFFRQGVISCERDVPLGTILIASGVLGPAALEEGLSRQRKQRSMPIGEILVEQHKVDSLTVIEAVDLQKEQNLRIGEVLRDAGILSERELQRALEEQRRRKGRRLGEILVELDVLTERDLAVTLGLKFAMPFMDAGQLSAAPEAVALVGGDLIERHQVLPLSLEESTLTVAVADPTDFAAIEALRSTTKRRVRTVITTNSALKRLVDEQLRRLRTSSPSTSATSTPSRNPETERSAIAEDGVGRLLNDLFLDAHRRQLSELYIEANGKQQRVTVRHRAGERWLVNTVFPPIVRNALVARLKAAALLDTGERHKPQRGTARWSLGEAQAIIQVTTLPNATGDEDVALRLRTPMRALGLGSLGLSPENLDRAKQVMQWRRGLVVCAGPTASGKTTLLHALVSEAAREGVEILSAEDPVEIVNPVCRQLTIAPAQGSNFAAAARLLVQANPNVLMLGELRDDETARVAAEGVLRGQLVLAGVVASHPSDALLRLECAGIQRQVLARMPTCVIATRTLRALCPHCVVRDRATRAEFDQLANIYNAARFGHAFDVRHAEGVQLSGARGCEQCSGSGYQGLLGVQEIIMGDNEAAWDLRPAIAPDRDQRTLLQDAVAKVLAGRTDLRQLQATFPFG